MNNGWRRDDARVTRVQYTLNVRRLREFPTHAECRYGRTHATHVPLTRLHRRTTAETAGPRRPRRCHHGGVSPGGRTRPAHRETLSSCAFRRRHRARCRGYVCGAAANRTNAGAPTASPGADCPDASPACACVAAVTTHRVANRRVHAASAEAIDCRTMLGRGSGGMIAPSPARVVAVASAFAGLQDVSAGCLPG